MAMINNHTKLTNVSYITKPANLGSLEYIYISIYKKFSYHKIV